MAVIVTSELLPEGQVLGVPAVQSGTGEEIAEGVLEVLEEWGLGSSQIAGLSFDTTASNTGAWNGACVILEERLECKLLYLACRRHIHELHIKHVSVNVGRPTKGSEDTLFKKFNGAWNTILDKGIDYGRLRKLDLDNCSSFVKAESEKTLQYLQECLSKKTFPREDYLEFCQLAVVFLGGKSYIFHNFRDF